MGQVGVTETDHGLDQKQVFTCQNIAENIVPIEFTVISQNLGIIELAFKSLKKIRT